MRLRAAPPDVAELVATSHRVTTSVDSWRGGVLLAGAIPLTDGRLIEKADQRVPERVTLQVPRFDAAGRDLHPGTDPLAPLAANGQRVRITNTLHAPEVEAPVQLGWFHIVDWESDGDTIEVEALGLLNVVDEYRLLAPTSPPVGATFKSEIKRLLEGTLPLYFEPGLVDRAVPRSMAWQDDRLGALIELAQAWPAHMFVDEAGVCTYAPPLDAAAAADVELAERLGTVVVARDSGTRDGIANIVVARGEDSSDAARPAVAAIARDTAVGSPTAADGPYGNVVEFLASPLLTTTARALAAAETRLSRRLLLARSVPMDTLPDPRLRPWVRADYARADGSVMRGRLTSTELPLTAAGGAGRIEVGELL